MLGPEGAASAAAAWLTATVPARLRRAEVRLGLPAGSLPNPALVADHDTGPLALEDWPALIVLPVRTIGLDLVDVDEDAGEAYRVTYALEVLAWVRADTYATTDALRNRYVLAIREALLERKQLAAADAPATGVAVVPASIREDYSPVLRDNAGRTIAGVRVEVNVIVGETLEGPTPQGTADTVDVTATGTGTDPGELPAHPALT